MAHYNIEIAAATVAEAAATLFKVGFGDPAQNDEIVRAAEARMGELKAAGIGGQLALVNGPASLPVAVVLAHHLIHLFGVVAVFDPKMAAYVVASSHDPSRPVGTLIPAADVKTP